MIQQTNILSVLPAKPPVEATPPRESFAKDDSFLSHIEEAVKNSSSQREKQAARAAEDRKKTAYDSQETQPTRNENLPVKEHENFSSGDTPIKPTQTKETEISDSDSILPAQTTTNQEKIVDQLKALGVSEKNIHSLLKVLNLNGDANLKSFTQALADTLGQQPSLTNNPLPQNPATGEQSATPSNNADKTAQELLLQSGLTQQQAKDLLSKVQSAPLQTDANQANRELQLKGKANIEETLDQKFSLEKILAKTQEGISSSNEKPAILQPSTGSGKQEENLIAPNLLASLSASASKGNANALKGTQTLTDQPDVQVTQINTSNNSSAKILESQKAFASQTLTAKGSDDAKVIQQILNKVSLRTHGNQNEIKIRLDPPSLGTVRMHVTASGDAVKTVIMTDSNAVKQIIENNLAQLRDALNGSGLKVESFTVLVGGDQGSGTQQNTSHENRFGFTPEFTPEDNLSQEASFGNSMSSRERIFYNESMSISVMA